MHQLDGSSTGGALLTITLWWVAHITLSEVATICAICAAVSTIWVNIKKLRKK